MNARLIYVSISDQIRSLTPLLAALYGLVFALFLGIVVLRLVYGFPMANLTRDAAQIEEFNPFFGTLSHLGIILWCATASICIFCSILLRRYTLSVRSMLFLLYAGILTILLMLDDLFLIHDVVFPLYLGLAESWLYLVYVLSVILLLAIFYREILNTDFLVLLLAFIFFGFSVLMDMLGEQLPVPGIFLIEDGFKFLGIASWFVYFIRSCFQIARQEIALAP